MTEIRQSPYMQALGMIASCYQTGLFELPAAEKLIGRTGFLHGGALSGFLTVACDTLVGQSSGETALLSTTTAVSFIRGAREQTTFARVRIVVRGARLLVVEGGAWQEAEEKPVAQIVRKYLITD